MADTPKTNLLSELQDAPSQMLSRQSVLDLGIDNTEIAKHEERGEIIVTDDGPLASIFITSAGLADIKTADPADVNTDYPLKVGVQIGISSLNDVLFWYDQPIIWVGRIGERLFIFEILDEYWKDNVRIPGNFMGNKVLIVSTTEEILAKITSNEMQLRDGYLGEAWEAQTISKPGILHEVTSISKLDAIPEEYLQEPGICLAIETP